MAQTYKFGNGTWARKKGSTLAYSDTNNAFKPLPFSFERNSIATRVNKDGLIEVVGNDIPRIDYKDSTDGVLLLENSATNLITYSEAFDNAYWTKSGSSVTSGFTSPKGDLSAFKLVENTSNSLHYIYSSGISVSAVKNNFSAFVKSAGKTKLAIRESSGTGRYASFDLTNKSVIEQNGTDAKIEELINGWFRISFNDVTTTSTVMGLFLLDDSYTSGSPTTTYQGDGTSGIYIFGTQLEIGNASSYIPTNGSTIQRAAETCNGSGNSEVFNDSQGVLFANISSLDVSGDYRLISISDGTNNNRVFLGFRLNTGYLYYFVVSGGSTQSDFISNKISVNKFSKIAVKYKDNDFAFWVDGLEIYADSSGNTPIGLDRLQFTDADGNTRFFYGKTKQIAYYDTALTDEELEYLTSYRSLNELVTELNLNTL